MTHVSARRGAVYVSVAATAWGTGGAAGSLLFQVGGLGPVGVSLWRYLLGAVFLLLVTRITRLPGPQVVVVGVGMAIYQTAYFGAIAEAGIAVATVVTMGVTPVFTALGSRLFLGERLGRVGAFALVAALAGLILLAGPSAWNAAEHLVTQHPQTTQTPAEGTAQQPLAHPVQSGPVGAGPADAGPADAGPADAGPADAGPATTGQIQAGQTQAGLGGELVGVGLGLVSGAGYAGVTLVSRRYRVDAGEMAVGGFLVGAACLLPFALVDGVVPQVSVLSVSLLVYLGAIPTALAYGLFFRALTVLNATTVSIISLGEAVGAALLGVVVFGERLTSMGWAGCVCLLAAVVVLTLAT